MLYGALDVDLNADFESMKQVNFVCEGEGDATLFEKFHALFRTEQPFPNTYPGFYQGGKCSDIQRYLTRKPIQLGSRWIFILDSNAPAQKLRAFLEGKYKDHIGHSVFVAQYEPPMGGTGELEDVLPRVLVREVVLSAANQHPAASTITWELDENFASWFERLADGINEPALKEKVKARLNDRLSLLVNEVSDEAGFKGLLPEYAAWATSAMTAIRNTFKRAGGTGRNAVEMPTDTSVSSRLGRLANTLGLVFSKPPRHCASVPPARVAVDLAVIKAWVAAGALNNCAAIREHARGLPSLSPVLKTDDDSPAREVLGRTASAPRN